MTSTRDKLKNPPRPPRLIPLPGGLEVHIRDVTLAEIRKVEALAAKSGRDGDNALGLCAYALAEPDGSATFPRLEDPDDAKRAAAIAEACDAVAGLTLEQIKELCRVARGDKDDAKNA
jgi:hypothetical protein